MDTNTDINGCGAKGAIIRPPYALFFKASCNKHDEGYTRGGNSTDRMNCDANFLRYMLVDTMSIKNKIKRFYFQCWAVIYFLAVRLFGKKHFNYEN